MLKETEEKKGKNKKDRYDIYSKKIEQKANQINLKKAVSTERKGKSKVRDVLVLTKYVWGEAQSYLAPLQAAVIFLALTGAAVITFNFALRFIWGALGIANPFQFPVELSAFVIIIFVIGILILGFIAVRYVGTQKRSVEITQKMNAGTFLLDEEICEVKEEQEEMKKMIEEQGVLIKEVLGLVKGTPLKKKVE